MIIRECIAQEIKNGNIKKDADVRVYRKSSRIPVLMSYAHIINTYLSETVIESVVNDDGTIHIIIKDKATQQKNTTIHCTICKYGRYSDDAMPCSSCKSYDKFEPEVV